MKEQIKALVSAKSFTADQKDFLKSAAAEFGIEFEIRKGCRSCYNDLAIQIYNEILKVEPKVTTGKYTLKSGVDVQIGYPQGKRLNAATVTDEWAAELIEKGLKKYFENAN